MRPISDGCKNNYFLNDRVCACKVHPKSSCRKGSRHDLRQKKHPSETYQRFLPELKPKKIEKVKTTVVTSLQKPLPEHFRHARSTAEKRIMNIVKYHINDMEEEPFGKPSKKIYEAIQNFPKSIKDTGVPNHFSICKINNAVGNGVFLKPNAKPLKKGDFIGVYAGEYKIHSYAQRLEHDGSYSFDILEDLQLTGLQRKIFRKQAIVDKEDDFYLLVDAKERGNFTRNINGAVNANAEAVFYDMPDGTAEVVIQALKTIQPGQQVLLRYGRQYWETKGIKPIKMTPSSYRSL